MISEKIKDLLRLRRCTLLGVGPMSVNCVDAAIEIANTHGDPLILIASRRQIDSEYFGGGYVNNWSTERFSEYVTNRDKRGKIYLARDHGGPWQNEMEKENRLSLKKAMDSAKESYRADIDAGFQILHIDPSIDIHGKPTTEEILERVFELYEFCCFYAKSLGREVVFEIGTEEQSGSTNTQDDLEYVLLRIKEFCLKFGFPLPTFVVIQTGTRVMETRNVGSFDNPLRVAGEIPAEIQVPKMIEICNKHDILMKEHNADYLSDEALEWHPRLGIHSANIAPQLGVAETTALVRLMEENNMTRQLEDFLMLSFSAGKWKKWMINESNASDWQKSIIGGHYIFSLPECEEIKSEVRSLLDLKGIDLDHELRSAVKSIIYRYMKNFRLLSKP